MVAWYVGDDKYAAVAVWTANTVKVVGDFVRQTAPTDANARVFRCTTAGTTHLTTEPTWNVAEGTTTNDNTAVWTEVTGLAAYGWSAPFKRHAQAFSWGAFGDTPTYVSSSHNYSVAGAITFSTLATDATQDVWILSVNPAGSTPPVAADLLAGATETTTGNNSISIDRSAYIFGFRWVAGSGATGTANINLGATTASSLVLDSCNLTIATTGISSRIVCAQVSGNLPNDQTWLNVAVKFGATAQAISGGPVRLQWVGGSVDGAGSIPTNLFKFITSAGSDIYLQGVDLSALGSNTIVGSSGNSDRFQFVGCRLGASFSFFAGGVNYGGPEVVAINCHSGNKNFINQKHTYLGNLTTEETIIRTGGASDGTTGYSWKIVTTAKAVYAHAFDAIRRAKWNDVTGSAVTLSVEIENDGTTLTNADIWVDIDYLSSASDPTVTRVSSKAATILTTGTNLTTSSETWTTTGHGSPVKQTISVSFTPQMKGYVYYTVKIAKASATIYVDPKASIA